MSLKLLHKENTEQAEAKLESRLTDQVLRVLRFERITEEELAQMLRRAAITRLRGFNRRYYHWLFKVQGDVLQEMQHVDIVTVG